jgi:hypothetical protein
MEARREGDRDLPRRLEDGAAPLRKGRAGDTPDSTDARRRLPEDRVEVGRKFKVGDYEGYIHVGLYEDARAGFGTVLTGAAELAPKIARGTGDGLLRIG